MWNDSKSIGLSKCFVVLFMAALIAGAVIAPWVLSNILQHISEGKTAYFLVTVYAGSVPAAALLIFLYVLLQRIGKGQVFVKENVSCLRYISWCCFIGAVIAMISVYWVPWLAVGVAAGFMGLIIRVIKNIVAKAIELQDDVDHMI